MLCKLFISLVIFYLVSYELLREKFCNFPTIIASFSVSPISSDILFIYFFNSVLGCVSIEDYYILLMIYPFINMKGLFLSP